MGVIDLDPASCSAANVVVKARKFYNIADDGLSKSWGGCVWLNPPYAADLVVKFAEKLAENVISGNVTQACVLVNNATETKWMQALGIDAGIAHNWEEYMTWAVKYGLEPEFRNSIKQKLIDSKNPTNLAPLWNPQKLAMDMYIILQTLLNK